MNNYLQVFISIIKDAPIKSIVRLYPNVIRDTNFTFTDDLHSTST